VNNKMLMISILVLLISHLITLYRLSARKREINQLKVDLGKHIDRNGYGAHDLKWPLENVCEHQQMFEALLKYLKLAYRPPRKTEAQFVQVGLIDKEAELRKEKKMEPFDL
jgi:hypothetical protein